MLSRRYANDGKPALRLNPIQEKARRRVEDKVRRQAYTFEVVPCAVCGGAAFEKLAEKDRYGLYCPVVICRDCGLVQTNPRMTQEAYNDFYNADYRQLYVGTETATDHFFREQYEHGRQIYEYLRGRLPEKGLVVEIGCGAGGILKFFEEKGYTAKGVDLGAEYVDYGRSAYGLDLEVGTLESLAPDAAPVLIIYSHVLEHILHPDQELRRLRQLMSSTSLLYIEVPGLLNLTKNYQMDFLRYLQNAHTYHFSLDSLTNLAGKEGFTRQRGDEQVKSIFRRGGEDGFRIKNIYASTIASLKRYEWLRRFYKLTPHFIGLVLRKTFGRRVRAYLK